MSGLRLSSKHEAPLGTTNINNCLLFHPYMLIILLISHSCSWHRCPKEISPYPCYHFTNVKFLISVSWRSLLKITFLEVKCIYLFISLFDQQTVLCSAWAVFLLFFNCNLVCINTIKYITINLKTVWNLWSMFCNVLHICIYIFIYLCISDLNTIHRQWKT